MSGESFGLPAQRRRAGRAAGWAQSEDLSGGYRILRVRIDTLAEEHVFLGREDECEVLIEGTVEGVSFSDDAAGEEEADGCVHEAFVLAE